MNMIQIAVDPSLSSSFVQAGDSGSLVVTGSFIPGKIGVSVLGILTLGSSDGSYGLANPIGQVLAELNVDLYVYSYSLPSGLPPPVSCEEMLQAIGALQDHIDELTVVFQQSGNNTKLGQRLKTLADLLARLKREAKSAGCEV
jgi:hypothetical protein